MQRAVNFWFKTLVLIIAALCLAAGSAAADAANQIVTVEPAESDQAAGTSFTRSAMYSVSDNNNMLSGLDCNVHFNSNKVTYTGYANFLNIGSFTVKPEVAFVVDDIPDLDGDPLTNKRVQMSWLTFTFPTDWPGVELPVKLADFNFTVNNDIDVASDTHVRISFNDTATGYTGLANDSTAHLKVPPRVANVSSTLADGCYPAGTQVPVTVQFDDTVDVAGGVPYLNIASGPNAPTAAPLTGGTGTNTLTFTYTVAQGDASADLDYVDTASLVANGATLQGPTGLDALLTLPTPGDPGSLSANKDIQIITAAPDAPVFDPPGGTFADSLTVNITLGAGVVKSRWNDTGATTCDRGIELQGNTLFISNANPSRTIYMTSCDCAGNASAEAQYTFDFSTTAPTFDPPAGTYKAAVDVTPGLPAYAVKSYYTTDGTEPTDQNGTLYDGTPIHLDGDTCWGIDLKMRSYDAFDKPGEVGTARYVFDKEGPAVTVDQPAGEIWQTTSTYPMVGNVNDICSEVASVEVSMDGGQTWNLATLGVDKLTWNYTANLSLGANNQIQARGTDELGVVSAPVNSPTINYYNALTLSVGGQDVTGGEVYVSNSQGNNTIDITVAGGTGNWANYGWDLNPGTFGVITPPIGETTTFTADVGELGDETLTVTDPASALAYNAELTIHVVELGITGPDYLILGGDAGVYNAQGNVGDVTWTATPANAVGIVPSGDKNTTATVTPNVAGVFTLKATDGNTGAFSEMQVEVVNPITVTPSANSCVIHGQTQQFNATGGTGQANTDYIWTFQPENAGTIDANGLFTAAAGQGEVGVAVTATDKTYGDLKGFGAVNVMDPLTITNLLPNDIMEANAQHDFNHTSGTGLGIDWVATSGGIDEFGQYWAPNIAVDEPPVVVTITATDSICGNLTDTYQFTVYGPVGITNKPAKPPVVQSGMDSQQFTGVGEDGDLNWVAIWPDGTEEAPVAGADYTFTAPTEGPFAGPWTIQLVGGSGLSMDEFTIYVPIKLVAAEYQQDKLLLPTPVEPVFMANTTGYMLWAMGSDNDLDIATADKPVVAGAEVLDAPVTSDKAVFDVDAIEPGNSLVTVRDISDPNGEWAGSLLVTVLGRSNITGTVGNVNQDLITDPTLEVQVSLNDPITRQPLDPPINTFVDPNGAFAFNGAPWGNYWIQVNVQDPAGPAYVPYMAGKLINLSKNGTVWNPKLPDLTPIADSWVLTGIMGGTYMGGGLYEYIVTDQASGAVVAQGTGDSAAFMVDLAPGLYILSVVGDGYLPFVSAPIDLDQDTAVPVDLQDQDTPLVNGEFYPAIGGVVNVDVMDASGAVRKLAINIPPLPMDLMQIDDYVSQAQPGTNNLNYDGSIADGGKDRYDINNPGWILDAQTVLLANVQYLDFGVLGNGLALEFEISRGPNAGTVVRYNPIPSAKDGRMLNAPSITLPLLLNTKTGFFQRLSRLSAAQNVLAVMVEERGDGTAHAHRENLPFVVSDDGTVLIDTYHVTNFGLGNKPVPPPDPGDQTRNYKTGNSWCFVDTVASTGASSLGWLLLVIPAILGRGLFGKRK